MSGNRERFESRFYRGFSSRPVAVAEGDTIWRERACHSCGAPHYSRGDKPESHCFACSNRDNPFAQKNVRFSVDAAGEDSTNPLRVKDGTNIYNMALPPVVTVLPEKDAYGQHKVTSRPQANNEIVSSRQLREKAKRGGLTVMETPKRAIGGKG